jgi:hypothetical protein
LARNLQLNFSHTFNGKVWTIKTDEEGTLLVIEIRNEELMHASFQLFDFKTSTLSAEIVLEEPWLVSLFYVSQSYLIFQTFESDANPEVKSYIGWSVKENKEIWRNDKWKNISIINHQLHLRNDTKDEIIAFNPADGEQIEINEVIKSKLDLSLHTPLFYSQQNEYFPIISRYVEQTRSESISAGAEYLEYRDLILISYYTGQQKMANNLLIVNGNKEILLNECLGTDLKGIGQDTFFIQNNKLIFVKNKTEFFIFQLP